MAASVRSTAADEWEEYYSSDRIMSWTDFIEKAKLAAKEKSVFFAISPDESEIKLIKFADETIDVAVCIRNKFSVSVVPSSKSVDLRDLLGFQCKITMFSQFA